MSSVKKWGLRAMDKLGKRHRTSKTSPSSGNDIPHGAKPKQTEKKEIVKDKPTDTKGNVPKVIHEDTSKVAAALSEAKLREIVPINVQLPMEVVELIIDHAPDGPTFVSCSLVCKAWLARCRYYIFSRIYIASGSCGDLLPILRPMSRAQTTGSDPAHVPLPPAGNFVQSLVVTQTAPSILTSSPVHATNAKSLLDIIPNIRELYLKGVREWEIIHFLDPLVQAQKVENLTISHLQVENMNFIFSRILSCAPKLRSLRVGGLRFYGNQSSDIPALDVNSDSQRHDESNTDPSTPLPFENIETLGLEQETGSSYIDEFLGRILNSSSSALTRVVELELSLRKPLVGTAIFTRAAKTLTSLTLDFRMLRHVPEGFTFSLSPLQVLQHLRLNLPHDHGNRLPVAIIGALREYSHNTIQLLHIEFGLAWFFSSECVAAWREVDTLLASPHLGHMRGVELSGLSASITQIKTDVFPMSSQRGVLSILLK
ncbi:hypothetical protein M408DRAFT_332290 [Serendipita vermifera MAFF 305830]|uniref:F-box domain-containing protein n=1 Tax=Serendipita vermifera MAFF 305830 TaxID=933852 RepID=A0A0C3AU71_SERVB|nr:hypothetical protein M408DRAFT_332290 [Serendipita vermifera MAFF 305830]